MRALLCERFQPAAHVAGQAGKTDKDLEALATVSDRGAKAVLACDRTITNDAARARVM